MTPSVLLRANGSKIRPTVPRLPPPNTRKNTTPPPHQTKTTMPNNPGSHLKMPSPQDATLSSDPITADDRQHSVNKPHHRQLMPALDTNTPAGTKKIHQKKGKRLRSVYTSENPEGETDREVSLPSSSASYVADDSEFEDSTMETPRQRRHRAHRSSPVFGFGEWPSILQQQMASQATIVTNNAILSTVEILTSELKELKDLVTTLAGNINVLKNQKADLKQGQSRLEQQIQRMGRQQREPTRQNPQAEQATGANTQPVQNRRTNNQTQPPAAPSQNTPTQTPAPTPDATNTWAKVARKGNEKKKETLPGPAKRMERTIVVHRLSEAINEELTSYK